MGLYIYCKIYGGADETSPLLTTLCHASTADVTLTTDGNTALLTMNSDGSVRGTGFRVTYTTLPGGILL